MSLNVIECFPLTSQLLIIFFRGCRCFHNEWTKVGMFTLNMLVKYSALRGDWLYLGCKEVVEEGIFLFPICTHTDISLDFS